MISQLVAQRQLSLNPDCDGAAVFRQALRLCSSPKTSTAQLAGMQAALSTYPRTSDISAEINDLLQQALTIRRATLQQQARGVSFSIGGRGRLVGA